MFVNKKISLLLITTCLFLITANFVYSTENINVFRSTGDMKLMPFFIKIVFWDIESCNKFLDFMEYKNIGYGDVSENKKKDREHLRQFLCSEHNYNPSREDYILRINNGFSYTLLGYSSNSTIYNYGLKDTFNDKNLDTPQHYEFFNFMGYSDGDIDTISKLFEQVKLEEDSRFLVKQTDKQFNEFQQKVEEYNNQTANNEICNKIVIVNRVNGWTAYVHSFKDCQYIIQKSASKKDKMFINIISVILIIYILAVLFLLLKKR